MPFNQCGKWENTVIKPIVSIICSDIISFSWVNSVLLGAAGAILLVFIGNGEDVIIALQMPDVFDCLMLLYYVLDTGFLFQLCIVFVAAYSSTVYVRDKNAGLLNTLLLRISCKCYFIARGVQCFVSSFVGTGIMCIIMVSIWHIFLPIGNLKILIYLIAETSIAIAFWCECGLALSAFVPNRFVAMTSPFVLQYVIGRLCFSFMPERFNLTLYLCGSLLAFADENSKLTVFVQGISLFSALTIIVYIVFYCRASKELIDGK